MGNVPAFGVGWRLTQEPFMKNNKIFTDVMLRLGWGITGNQIDTEQDVSYRSSVVAAVTRTMTSAERTAP